MHGLSHEARLRYIAEYATQLYRKRKRDDARKLMAELEDVQVTDLSTGIVLVDTLVLMNKTDAAEKIIAQLAKPTPKQLSQYIQPYKRLTTDYIRDGHIDKAVTLLWTFCERTKPDAAHPRRIANTGTSLSVLLQWPYTASIKLSNPDGLLQSNTS